MTATICESLTIDGLPCRKHATHVWRGRHCCVYHGDPALHAAGRQSRNPRRQWHDDNLELLYQLTASGETDAEIARRLRTSVYAVQKARTDYGIARRKRIALDAIDVARMFGRTNSSSVRLWIARGYLRAKRSAGVGRQLLWHIDYDDLEAFVRDERYWHLWSPDEITRRTLLASSGRPRELRYLSVAQVAGIVGVSADTPTKWCRHGWLRCARNGRAYLVRSDWLDEFREKWSYGDGIGLHRRETAA